MRKHQHKSFILWEELGFHILPVHYYSSIPEIGKLRDDVWRRVSELIGININEGFQLKLLEGFQKCYGEEFSGLPLYEHERSRLYYYIYSSGFGSWMEKFNT